MYRPQIRLQPRVSIEVMTVVNHDLIAWIKTVNEISAPIVGTEHGTLDASLRHEVHSIYRHSLRIEVRVHQRRRTDSACVRSDYERRHRREDWPQVASHSRVHCSHSVKETSATSRWNERSHDCGQ